MDHHRRRGVYLVYPFQIAASALQLGKAALQHMQTGIWKYGHVFDILDSCNVLASRQRRAGQLGCHNICIGCNHIRNFCHLHDVTRMAINTVVLVPEQVSSEQLSS